MKESRQVLVWVFLLLPCLAVVGLLIPGDHWVVQEIRTFSSLIVVLILPGYVLGRLLRLFDALDNWFDVLSLSVTLTWAGGLVLWLFFFFLGVSLPVVSAIWGGVGTIGLIASAFVPLPQRLQSRPTRPWLVGGIAMWILALTGAAYLYGGQIDGDAWSYMAWLRNITVGDIQPGVNIHAGWEVDYPFFKNLYSPTLFYYAMSSWLGRVDPGWIWTRAQAVWVSVMLAAQFSLTYCIFKRRSIGFVSILLAPILFAYGPIHTSSLGDSISLSNYVLLPLSLWLLSQSVFRERRWLSWWMVIAVVVSTSLTFEHFPHIVYFLLNAGMLALLGLFPGHQRSQFSRTAVVIVLTILISLPFILQSWQLAKAYRYDTATAIINIRAKRGPYWGGDTFFALRPQTLLGNHGLLWLFAAQGLLFVWRYRHRFWKRHAAELLIGSPLIVLFIGFNPLLVPILSRLLAPLTISRLWDAMVILPSLSYGLMLMGSRLYTVWRYRRRVSVQQVAAPIFVFLLVSGHLIFVTVDAAQIKIKSILYGPGDATPILTERVVRRVLESELQDSPYPILVPLARLTRYLDAATLDFIRRNVPSDSVFLAERLTELHLSAHADQLAYLGRLGWPEWGDICPRIRAEGAKAIFPTLARPEVYRRLDVACGILDPNIAPIELEALLMDNRPEIDYILVTPNTAYLEAKLDQIMPQARVYTGDGFAIYALKGQEAQSLD